MLTRKRLQQRLRPCRSGKQTLLVAGNQRSGTNMLMNVLERSAVTDVFHEHDDRAYDNYLMREMEVISRLHANSPAPHVVLKTLCELDAVPQLMEALAPARTVWLFRDYCDVVNSMRRSFGDSFRRQLARIASDPCSDDWRAGGMSQATRQIVESAHAREVNEESAAALQWYFRNVLFLEQSLDVDSHVLLVAYERLVEQPDSEFARICKFADIPLTEFMTARVFATSVGKNPAPGIDAEIAAHCAALQQRLQSLLP